MDAVGRTFLGLTLGCARCHDHKTDPITQRDYYAIAGVFASARIADRSMMKARGWAPIQTARQTVARLEEQRVKLENKVKANDLSKDERSALETRITGLSRDILKIKTSTPDYHAPTVNGVLDSALYVEPADGGHGTKRGISTFIARATPIVRGPLYHDDSSAFSRGIQTSLVD